MAVTTLPPSSGAGSYTHDTVREKINEIIGQSNGLEISVNQHNLDIPEIQLKQFTSVVTVRQPSDLSGTLDSTKAYFLDGVIDFSGTGLSIEIPIGGLNLYGSTFNISGLKCTDASYTLFSSPFGGSGDLVMRNLKIQITGTASKVFDIEGATGGEAIELISVNYIACKSLGNISTYRQIFESGTGRFGGTPELTLIGSFGGYKIANSIMAGMSNFTALFKAGAGLQFSGRFATNANCDLPATGALADFSSSNFFNDESFVINGAYLSRAGVFDVNDTGILPNIDGTSVKASFIGNTGIKNTTKYIKAVCSAEVATTISAPATYYVLSGTMTLEESSHFDSPSNGVYRLLSGSGACTIFGGIEIAGTADDVIGLKITKSTDGGSTFPTTIGYTRRTINNLVGGIDVAFFNLDFTAELSAGDRIRLETDNETGARNVTMKQYSYISIRA